MEHKKVNAKLPLATALLLLEQLTMITHIYSAKIKIGHIETGCTNCRQRNIKTIKKALSDCCPELFDNEAQIEVEIKCNDDVLLTLQAFHSPKLGHIIAVR